MDKTLGTWGGQGLERDGGGTPVLCFVPWPGERRGSEMKARDRGDDFEFLTTTASATACDHRCAQAVNLNPPTRANKSHVHKGTHTAWKKEKKKENNTFIRTQNSPLVGPLRESDFSVNSPSCHLKSFFFFFIFKRGQARVPCTLTPA